MYFEVVGAHEVGMKVPGVRWSSRHVVVVFSSRFVMGAVEAPFNARTVSQKIANGSKRQDVIATEAVATKENPVSIVTVSRPLSLFLHDDCALAE